MEAILGLVAIILIICYLVQTGSFAGILAIVLLIVMLVFAVCFFKTPPKQQEKPSDPETKPISLSSEPPLDIAQKADEFVTRGVPLDAVANFRDGYVTAEEIERCILSGDFKVASSSLGGNPHLIHSQERERRKAKRFYPVAQMATNNSHSNPKTLIPESTPSSQLELKERLLAKHGHPPKKTDIVEFTDISSCSSDGVTEESDTTDLPTDAQSNSPVKPRITKSQLTQRNVMALTSELQKIKGRLEANQEITEYPLQAKEVPWSLEVTQSRLLRIRARPDKKRNDMNEYTQRLTHGEQFSEAYISKPEEYNGADGACCLDSGAAPKIYIQEDTQVLCGEVKNCSEIIFKA